VWSLSTAVFWLLDDDVHTAGLADAAASTLFGIQKRSNLILISWRGIYVHLSLGSGFISVVELGSYLYLVLYVVHFVFLILASTWNSLSPASSLPFMTSWHFSLSSLLTYSFSFSKTKQTTKH
jgi:hypothetical protein